MLGRSDTHDASRMMWGRRVRWHDLKTGEKLTVRMKPFEGKFNLKALVLTDNPHAFAPKTARIARCFDSSMSGKENP